MREFTLSSRYLLFPVRTGAPKSRLALWVDGRAVREFDIELAAAEPEFEVFLEVLDFAGKRAELRTADGVDSGLAAVRQVDALPDAAPYGEALRPQFHFTSRRGWLNDPNGLVYADGLWHLYYQHNPYGWNWGNMHWGHAVSEDLVCWRELGIALYPRAYGDWAYSGSGFMLPDGRLGIAYTSTGRGECVAFSDDGGRSFAEIPENPVVRHRGRDPKVFWYEPGGHWVMAVYDEFEDQRWIVIHTSPDLRTWTFASRIGGFYECPELFPIRDESGRDRWILYGADGEYMVGGFDGREFRPEGGKQRLWFGEFYASQTYTNAPDGRRVQIGWGRGIVFPGMPFNQQMGIACELTLVDGTLRARPVPELARLRGAYRNWRAGERPAGEIAELVEVTTTLSVPAGGRGGLTVRGVPVVWDRAAGTLEVADGLFPLALEPAELDLRILVDRGSVEVFAAAGRLAVAKAVRPDFANRQLAGVGEARFGETFAYELGSIW
ncbi:MAG: glycoside hydrolase family 32 protein [Lentisphaeria bacterium]|jgi:fructan beta-fructosidase|nr:glycoside hydrolase family 32 protein [Lentisphaeria bacterium]